MKPTKLFQIAFLAQLLLYGFNVVANTASLAPVARVAVSVGETKKLSAAGQEQVLIVGSSLSVGDRIRTGADSVAILIFSDEGRISLRAYSELLIRHYQIDPTGDKTRIELELIKGTLRQISGNGSRVQPDRYRLNTPVAVIGVRGTDFLAKTSNDAVEAFVHEGKIVLTPVHGPCAQRKCDQVAMASSDSQLKYVRLGTDGRVEQREFRQGELESIFGIDMARGKTPTQSAGNPMSPSRLESDEAQLPEGTRLVTSTIFAAYTKAEALALQKDMEQPEPGASQTGSADVKPTSPPVLQSVPSDTTSSASAPIPDNTANTAIVPSAPIADSTTNTAIAPSAPTADSTTNTASVPNIPSVPSVPSIASMSDMPKQLVWGRFSNAKALPETLLMAFAEAREGRHVTVGELGEYALWRANPLGRMNADLSGQANFRLNGADAVLVDNHGTSSQAQVTAATLGIDFDRSRFKATVDLNHPSAGPAGINVAGKINEEGVFLGTNLGPKTIERVAGALTRDGTEAGYLFSKYVDAGTFKGITLWNR